MPIDYKEYHPKWSLISYLIRVVRAKNHCENCDVRNGEIIKRKKYGTWRYLGDADHEMIRNKVRYGGCNYAGALKFLGFTKIVLTVAHVDHDKTHNRFWNLKAWCQRCHLRHDLRHHIANRKYGRKHKGKHQLKLSI